MFLALRRYDTRSDVKFAKDAPVIGLVLQRSHLVTGDEGHYSGVVSNLESRGAKVSCMLWQQAGLYEYPVFINQNPGPGVCTACQC